MKAATTGSPFLAALRGEPTERRPIWIMRQAGRYLDEYQAVRAKHPFIEVCRTPELACEVTLQPIRRFGFDAAILFSDILVPLSPMGADFRFDDGGPKVDKAIREESQVAALRVTEPRETLGYVAESIRLLKGELGATPLIGFAGAPFTLASYLVEGGGSKEYVHVKSMMFRHPELFESLLNKLTEQVAAHLLMQVEAGVDAVQLFDTWAGILSPEDFARFALPAYRRIFAALAHTGVPRILFLKGCAPYLEMMNTSGADVIGLDWTVNLADSLARVPGKPVQGNLDPTVLYGDTETIRSRARAICAAGDAAPGHVFNLGHGILPTVPVSAVETLVDTVQSHRPGGGE
jgi:uroporphyrinogen decarboxylase